MLHTHIQLQQLIVLFQVCFRDCHVMAPPINTKMKPDVDYPYFPGLSQTIGLELKADSKIVLLYIGCLNQWCSSIISLLKLSSFNV